MPRQKGTPKTGGRKKGTPNKTTAQFKELIGAIVFENLESLQDMLRRETDITDFNKELQELLNKDKESTDINKEIQELLERYQGSFDPNKFGMTLATIKALTAYVVPKQTEQKISIDEESLNAVHKSIEKINDIFK